MTPTHSTQISMLLKHCPQAMAWAMEGRKWISEARLDLGVCAHAAMQACAGVDDRNAWYSLADGIVAELSSKGYKWDGTRQPPLNLEQAQQGASLAIEWMERNGSIPASAHVELGLSINDAGEPCDYEDGYLQAILDVIENEVVEDEEGATETHLVVADWKTAWNADESLFDGLQAKIQATVANAHFPVWDVLRMEIRNLRTWRVHSMEIRRDDEGEALLAKWKHDAMQAAQVARLAYEHVVAVPGAGCVGCPYCAVCFECEHAIASPTAAVAWLTAKAKQEALRPVIAKQCREAPIITDEGWIGYEAKAKAAPTKDVPRVLWDYWHSAPNEDSIVGLLTAMKPGVTQVRAVAKAIGKVEGKDAEADFLDAALDETVSGELVVKKMP